MMGESQIIEIMSPLSRLQVDFYFIWSFSMRTMSCLLKGDSFIDRKHAPFSIDSNVSKFTLSFKFPIFYLNFREPYHYVDLS
jgi:hypothetical protein